MALADPGIIGLRGRYNERSDFLITATPPVAEDTAPSTDPLYFPQLATGGGYTTQFILFSAVRDKHRPESCRSLRRPEHS